MTSTNVRGDPESDHLLRGSEMARSATFDRGALHKIDACSVFGYNGR
jgi:hypothetical protein